MKRTGDGKLYVAEATDDMFGGQEEWKALQRIRPCEDRETVEARLAAYKGKHGGRRYRKYRCALYKRARAMPEAAGE